MSAIVEGGMARCQLTMPSMKHLFGYIRQNARHAKRMVNPDTRTGKTVVICGAGPSLAAHVDALPWADEVWACNSALPYLMDSGARVTHGFCIDQGEEMLEAHEWGRTFRVGYYISSSVHPNLVRHLLRAGRRLTFFHSFLGIPEPDGWDTKSQGMSYEMSLCRTLYPNSVQVGHGLNSVPRAVCLAVVMGFARILVYGADCACAPDGPPMPCMEDPEQYGPWLEQLTMYADGRTAGVYGLQNPMAEGVIDGRRWHTRPDMIVSARHLLELDRTYPGRIELVGDTMVNAIRDKDEEWMARMPALSGVGLVTGFGAYPPREPVEVSA